MLRLMTLNLWRYYDWQERESAIVRLLTTESPDIVALQEVQTNLSFGTRPQSDYIADQTALNYRVFAPSVRKTKQIDSTGHMQSDASHGLALLSRYPIIRTETYFLKQQPDDSEQRSVLFTTIDVGDSKVDVCNVHFSNNDRFAKLHLRELIHICDMRKIQPIILGDFNIFKLANYKHILPTGYSLSSDILAYVSFPKDNGTLDYIAVPGQYLFNEVFCSDESVSDHRAIIATILKK